MNRFKKIAATVGAVATPVAMFAQEATSAPNLNGIASGAETLFYGAAAVGVAILVYRIGRKALSKGI